MSDEEGVRGGLSGVVRGVAHTLQLDRMRKRKSEMRKWKNGEILISLLFNLSSLFHGKSGSMSAAAPIAELLSSGVGEAPGGPSVSPPFEHYKQKDASKGQSSVLGQHSLAKGQLLSPHSIESSLLHLTPFPALLVFLSYQVSSLIFPSQSSSVSNP